MERSQVGIAVQDLTTTLWPKRTPSTRKTEVNKTNRSHSSAKPLAIHVGTRGLCRGLVSSW